MANPPGWFAGLLAYARVQDHARVVRGWPWWARLLHRLRPCPACRAQLREMEEG